jgi:endonuclease YncB( thermonuclease family)
MSLERLTSLATTLAFAAAFAVFNGLAQAAPGCNGRNAGPAEVARVVDGRSFLLADGREVRLAAIETLLPVPDDQDEARAETAQAAKAALEALVLTRKVDLSVADAGSDRYGRLTAYVSAEDVPVQHALVESGYALVSPAASAACRTWLQSAERAARTRGLGLWGEPYSVVKNAADPADVLADQGRFALVHGTVASVRESAGIVYINFGRRWSDQFTATLLKRNEGSFMHAGVTPKSLAGRTVEVRGWIEERNGPTVELVRPEQIEIIH